MRYLALIGILFLSACSLFNKDVDFSCPKTGLIGDAATVTFLNDQKQPVAEATMRGYTGHCSFKKDAEGVTASLEIPFTVRRSAGEELKEKELSYFIAVLSPAEEVLQRTAFTTKVDVDAATNEGTTTEEHDVKIPGVKPEEAYKYKVVMGFTLTPEQLKYNEENK